MLEWTKHQQTLTTNVNQPDRVIFTHTAECSEGSLERINSHEHIKSAIECTVEKAIEFLHDNIQNDSLYFMCEWSSTATTLSIAVTDAKKQNNGPHRVCCVFSGINPSEALTENVQYWIRDYLTTCKGFMHYSLVAAFHSSGRDNSMLL